MSEEINSYRASEVWAAVEKNPDCAPEQLVRLSDHEAALAARDQTIAEQQTFINEEARKIAELKKAVQDHEEDCACLPEDRSVTETVTALCNEIADQAKRIAVLETKLKKYRDAALYAENVLNPETDPTSGGMALKKLRAALADQPAHEQPPTDHFEEAKRIVASWPQWKRDVFSRALADPERIKP
jgi:hypothetical protein